jgi:acyl-CoA hydrolase
VGYSLGMTEREHAPEPDRDLSPRRVSASQVTLVQLMEITDANIGGIVHGGTVMKLVDTAAGLAAMKHCGGVAVTVSMDSMSFLAPVRIGDTVTVKASVNDVGTTSLEVGVRVESEKVITGERTHTGSAYLVYVALDEDGKPRPVPPVIAETAIERRRQREAKIRRETRLEHKRAILEHRDRTEQYPEPGPNSTPPERDDQPEGHARRHLRI